MNKVRRKTIFIGCAFVVVLSLIVLSKLASQSHRNAAVINSSVTLRTFVDRWQRAGEPEGEGVDKLLVNYGSNTPFVYTNTATVGEMKFDCVFAIQSWGMAESGMFAITRDKTIIWVGEKGSRVVHLVFDK